MEGSFIYCYVRLPQVLSTIRLKALKRYFGLILQMEKFVVWIQISPFIALLIVIVAVVTFKLMHFSCPSLVLTFVVITLQHKTRYIFFVL